MTASEQLEEIAALAQHLHLEQQDSWRAIRNELAEQEIVLLDTEDLGPKQLKFLEGMFQEEIFPVLTPMAVDPAHPFPFIPNLAFRWLLSCNSRARTIH